MNSSAEHHIPSIQSTPTRQPSPPPPPKRDLSEEKESRVEVTFERFERVVLAPALSIAPESGRTAIRHVARTVVAGPGWTGGLEAYQSSLVKDHGADDPAGDSEMLFIKLLNGIANSAASLGNGVRTDGIVYGRVDLPQAEPPIPAQPDSRPLSAESFAQGKAASIAYLG